MKVLELGYSNNILNIEKGIRNDNNKVSETMPYNLYSI